MTSLRAFLEDRRGVRIGPMEAFFDDIPSLLRLADYRGYTHSGIVYVLPREKAPLEDGQRSQSGKRTTIGSQSPQRGNKSERFSSKRFLCDGTTRRSG